MHVRNLHLTNFMLFQNLDINFSKNINIISGENSTGKTIMLKVLYSSLKSVNELNKIKTDATKEKTEEILVNKLQGVFRPDNSMIGRLVGRKQGSNKTEVSLTMNDESRLAYEFGNRQEKHLQLNNDIKNDTKSVEPIYIPPKEIISTVENFASLYNDYHIAFEETYYDLACLLDRPLRKGPNTKEQNIILHKFEQIMDGKIIQKDKKFFLKVEGSGEFEMGLVSEGYRKLATIMYLIQTGSLGKNSVLFWDEPETNMNPKMIPLLIEAIVELAKMGVQVFMTTHDYFVQQVLNLIAEYQKNDEERLEINFISLYKENATIQCESASQISGLEHNSIMEEFDNLYDREQGMFYEA